MSLFTDLDYAEKANDRRSVSGIVVVLGNAAVSYSSNTQKIIAQSRAESEYVAVGDGVKEGLFVRQVLGFLVPSLSEKCIKVVWVTRFSMLDCHLVEGVWYIYDWDTGSSVLI